jgi:NADH pyrophosphatase NudC (nudix superfamily)
MSFLDKLSKGVGEAADRAKFEADKMLRVKRMNDEIGNLANEIEQATLAIGTKAIELRIAELEELIQKVEILQTELAAKKAELEAAKAEEIEETAPSARYCPNCGAAVQAGAKFCPSCGHKLS